MSPRVPRAVDGLSRGFARVDRVLGEPRLHRRRPGFGSGITSADISAVVQGPVSPVTVELVHTLRRLMPHAEIVLSCEADALVNPALPLDTIVRSPDPGPVPMGPENVRATNVNRQLASTKAGLLASTRPFALKLRSDLTLTSLGFLDWWGMYRARHGDLRVVEERVLLPTVYSRNPRRLYPHWTFHPSDWMAFGLTQDVQRLWSAEPYDRERVTAEHGRALAPEQHLWLGALAQAGHRPALQDVAASELSIANNLVLLDPTVLGIRFTKYPVAPNDLVSLYTFGEWHALYRRLCESGWTVPDVQAWGRRAAASAWTSFRSGREHPLGSTTIATEPS